MVYRNVHNERRSTHSGFKKVTKKSSKSNVGVDN